MHVVKVQRWILTSNFNLKSLRNAKELHKHDLDQPTLSDAYSISVEESTIELGGVESSSRR
jgi:hypothetical protein